MSAWARSITQGRKELATDYGINADLKDQSLRQIVQSGYDKMALNLGTDDGIMPL
jgi:hypothetical protein